MNWKKLLLIAAVVGAFTFASVPKSDAGVRVGIGIGLPVAYPVYPYPYPYAYGYPYGYAPYYASCGYYPAVYGGAFVYHRPVVVVRNGHHGHPHPHPH
jgi:hypothetical protein